MLLSTWRSRKLFAPSTSAPCGAWPRKVKFNSFWPFQTAAHSCSPLLCTWTVYLVSCIRSACFSVSVQRTGADTECVLCWYEVSSTMWGAHTALTSAKEHQTYNTQNLKYFSTILPPTHRYSFSNPFLKIFELCCYTKNHRSGVRTLIGIRNVSVFLTFQLSLRST